MRKTFAKWTCLIGIACAALIWNPGLASANPPKQCPGPNMACLLSTTNGNVWMHTAANSTSTKIAVIPKGATVAIACYSSGESVYGDPIWYWLKYGSSWGFTTGYYLNTGHDPNPGVPAC